MEGGGALPRGAHMPGLARRQGTGREAGPVVPTWSLILRVAKGPQGCTELSCQQGQNSCPGPLWGKPGTRKIARTKPARTPDSLLSSRRRTTGKRKQQNNNHSLQGPVTAARAQGACGSGGVSRHLRQSLLSREAERSGRGQRGLDCPLTPEPF